MNKIEDIKYVAEVIPSHNFYANHGKRWLDGTLSAFALVVLSPVFLVLVILECFSMVVLLSIRPTDLVGMVRSLVSISFAR